eukprot:CAMPEP_0176125766 /NCGR_PEP_ID=MMETSP0120_2-20121206/63461_1 /TAXON_ID=160619 /ORGANISM="Kryptoperidinium foliaceum, Strain CCMP 1326" /LENGTH=337 /DNA_ID=CAMNT_0017460655 /DNA_START=131 /DNA_END=1140 /DNA_ORIENTATION=-
MASDPRRRKPVLLAPTHEDAMDEDEDELFGDSSNAPESSASATAMPEPVTKTLISQILTPSPFPHHTSGPTSSRFRNAYNRIVTNPTTEVEAWQALMTEVTNCYRQIQSKIHVMDAEIQLQLDWIESLLRQRQANAQAKLEYLLQTYLGIEMDGSPTGKLGMATHSVDLWLIYVDVRSRQARREHFGEEALIRDWATKAYELALEYAGFGFQNHVLWKAYLQYVKMSTSGDPQHMVLLRGVYQRLVCHPMTGLDQLWQEYEMFERQQSEALAQALLGEFTPKYQHARTVYLERNRVFIVAEEHSCLTLWKTRTAYERTNPERLSTADLAVRIRSCYK